ncbi:MAG: hypothetical protein ACJ796_02225 [Gemmatimonadaceae bacterium]
MRRSCLSNLFLFLTIAGHACPLVAQQSDVSISPALSLPANGGTTAAGLALTLAGSPGFGLRASGHVALERSDTGTSRVTTWLPPWTADVDAVFALAGRPLGSRNRTAASYGFLGMGRSAVDTANVRVINKNWSYGVGTLVPLGSAVDVFGEWRWRMSKLVLPTARPKPARSKELRFGMSFHLAPQ